MAQDSQNLMALIGSMSAQQIRTLENVLKGARNKGMDKFAKARKASIDGFFAAEKIHHDTHINPDYNYEFQEYPKRLFAVLDTQNGAQTAWMDFESEDDTLELGEEWCESPVAAKAHYASLNPQEPAVEPEKIRRGRPPLAKQGEMIHA